jgi:hypothetical protein
MIVFLIDLWTFASTSSWVAKRGTALLARGVRFKR